MLSCICSYAHAAMHRIPCMLSCSCYHAHAAISCMHMLLCTCCHDRATMHVSRAHATTHMVSRTCCTANAAARMPPRACYRVHAETHVLVYMTSFTGQCTCYHVHAVCNHANVVLPRTCIRHVALHMACYHAHDVLNMLPCTCCNAHMHMLSRTCYHAHTALHMLPRACYIETGVCVNPLGHSPVCGSKALCLCAGHNVRAKRIFALAQPRTPLRV
jgi:hypothetical protein